MKLHLDMIIWDGELGVLNYCAKFLEGRGIQTTVRIWARDTLGGGQTGLNAVAFSENEDIGAQKRPHRAPGAEYRTCFSASVSSAQLASQQITLTSIPSLQGIIK